jgi:hypothetical protein
MMIPRDAPETHLDVTAAMHQPSIGQDIMANLLMSNIQLEETS